MGPEDLIALAAVGRHRRRNRCGGRGYCGFQLVRRRGGGRGLRLFHARAAPRGESEKIHDAADQAATQKADQQDEDQAQHQPPAGAKVQRILEEIAQIEPDGGAEQRPEQCAGAADRCLHDKLTRGVEGERVRRHEALHHAKQAAGKAGIGRGDDKGGELVAVDVVADGGGAERVVTDGAEDDADRRTHDAQRDHDADEIPKREERVERPIGVEVNGGEAEWKRRCRHAGQAVLAAGIIRERIELDEIEDFGDRNRDHREINAGAPQRDQPDQKADNRRDDRADDYRGDDVRKVEDCQQIGGDHAAGAVERRLAERQKAGVAEQYVEADAEQAPHDDAAHGRWRKAKMRQDERCGDQADRRQRFDQKGTSAAHQAIALIRGPRSQEGRMDEAPAPASSPRTA